MTRILLLAGGTVGRGDANPVSRSHEMACLLAEQLPQAQVTLLRLGSLTLPPPNRRVRVVTSEGGLEVLRQMLYHDVIIAEAFPISAVLLYFQKRLVLDLTGDPSPLALSPCGRRWRDLQLTLADYVLCASEGQRDFLVGVLNALGLITTAVYAQDPTLRRLLDVVPNGVAPLVEFCHTGRAIALPKAYRLLALLRRTVAYLAVRAFAPQ